jgi:hypothetical protein
MFNHYSRTSVIEVALIGFMLFSCGMLVVEAGPSAGTYEPEFTLVEQYPSPVISSTSPGTGGIEYGFEGGRVVKIAGIYHLITTEMMGGPMAVKTRIGYWTSADRIHWKRVSTLFASSGDFTGKDPRASLWGPMPVYNTVEGRWDLIYVAYHAAPDTKTEMRTNYNGRILRAVSRQKGYGGIGGPYDDVGVLLEPDADSQPWEGLQGTDSFFPYQVGKRWLGFYGSANTEHLPIQYWRVGLAQAAALSGPWTRIREGNPVPLEKRFAENPIVTQLQNGYYVAVYDDDIEYQNAIGYAWSGPGDGVHWSTGKEFVVQPRGKGVWADTVRTPLGLISEGHGAYTLFYTGFQPPPVSGAHLRGAVGFVTLKDAAPAKGGSAIQH